ncbi:YdeI/OmpD-associated family protein [Pseudonocardia kunmingensis]|uniref:Uncharacterized protein YdeI (YjbR/CyaY-like superfamily) n=1 Tax=Pseudonocardia kunmingensis TaxID=630975 RepID=A0A543DL12_9PSEU|nr:YdeI/OmpD-associated family protein [Pseudonocardia kunmingensis]TQM10036.1 uncharacterized protein YdeI (YjbR/CyaY-like superfamily) [Pseudonocardia kunmingensis]
MRDRAERFQPSTVAEWREWLADHHADRPEGVWLVKWRAGSGGPRLDHGELVEQALCFGWIDSTGRALDAQRTMVWFTRRRPGSGWSRLNKQRIARLTAAGEMAPAGLALVEAAQADGSWTLLDAVEDLAVPADLDAALAATPPARERWDALSRSARRAVLLEIAQARRPATRARRVAEAAGRAAAAVSARAHA